ncbi:MAG TPA: DUF3048 domain-containing protein [Candidatus Acidoferrum sp.]|nr:DUF3048 domain-containing protein [Candidatus Acidoferrum sp.]
MQKFPPTPLPAAALRRPQRKGLAGRGWIPLAAAVAVLFSIAGGFVAYANTLPTSVTLNLSDGETNVATDAKLDFKFSRPVAMATVQSALKITPSLDGTLRSVSGQTEFAWAPNGFFAPLTTYTVTVNSLTDLGHHPMKATAWSFTTTIEPGVASVTSAGATIVDGGEIDPGATLQLNFNDAMDQSTVSVTAGSKVIALKWAADYRSATIATTGIPSGPLVIQLAAGARDQTGHTMPAAFTLNTGIYYHDHETTTALKYPALIQIPNDYYAVDQNGLQAASMIFEYLAEGGITRLTAIYQDAPKVIGPMRSSRFISLKLARHYRGLLFQSGESQATASQAAGDPVAQFFDTVGYMYRTPERIAPDNLMINGTLVKKAEARFGIATFTLPKARQPLPGGARVTKISVPEHYSTYAYDPTFGTYQKTEAGHLYRDATTHQLVRIEMLILLHTQVELLNIGDGHGSYIHDYNLETSGKIDVYYKGHRFAGTWTSTGAHEPLTFKLTNGTILSLPPGLVWIDVVS